MAIQLKNRPNALPWPPICFGGALVVSLVLSISSPWRIGFGWPARVVGLIVLLFGLALHQWAIRTMKVMRANILPNRAADKLLDFGPFAVSRNPIYVGDACSLLGLGFMIDSLWVAAAAGVAGALVWWLAIRREEVHMAFKFGDAWDRYAATTPRWIGLSSIRGLRKP